jgi:hypothetical protein
MRSSLRKFSAVLVAIGLVAWQYGCASTKLPTSFPYKTRSKPGSICVVSARYQSDIELQKPPERSTQALKSAEKWILPVGPLPNDKYTGAFVIISGLVILLAAAVVGAAKAKPLPRDQVQEDEAVLNAAIKELRVQDTLREWFLRLGTQQAKRQLVADLVEGPTQKREIPDYRFLADRGVETVIEMGVEKLGLKYKENGDGDNPALSMFMDVRVRVIRTVDGRTLSKEVLNYISTERTFAEWASNDAQPFKEEIEICYATLAKLMVTRLLLGAP